MPKTVRITATQKFLHDRRYAKGRSYDVEPELAAYFVANGWATAEGLEPGSTGDASLDVHSVRNGQKATFKE